MNDRKIDELWKDFNSRNNFKINISNNPYFLGVKTKYEIILQDSKPIIKLVGILNKNNNGYTISYTVLTIEDINIKTLKFREIVDKRILWFIKSSYSDSKKNDWLLILRKYNAHKLIFNVNKIKVEFNQIFDNEIYFNQIKDLIYEIRTKASS